jgi:hypothetical protein
MKLFLVINTIDPSVGSVLLADQAGAIIDQRLVSGHEKRSTKLLVAIDAMLKKQKIVKDKLQGILVVSGPGGFSTTRSGVVIANTLAWACRVPLIGFELHPGDDFAALIIKNITKLKSKRSAKLHFVAPIYNAEPNITIKKKQ